MYNLSYGKPLSVRWLLTTNISTSKFIIHKFVFFQLNNPSPLTFPPII